jgi:O-antigen/teichoic acid export membrane protein
MIHNIFRDSHLKNSIYLVATNFVTSFVGFFFWVIAARYYPTDEIGITSAIFSSISLISMISSIGLSRALIFYLPRNRNTDKIISSCLTINIISSILFSLIFIFGLKVWSPELSSTLSELKNTVIFIIITIIISISGIVGAAFTAGRSSLFQMVKETIYHMVKIIPLFLFINFGAMGILLSISIGLSISIIIGFVLLFRVWKYIPQFKLDPIIKDMAYFSAGNYIADILYNLPKLIFPIMVLNTISAQSAGYFYIAIMVASLLYGISQGIASSFLVESSDEDKFWFNVNKSIKFNLILLLPGILLFVIFGKFVLYIFNPSYAENAFRSMVILTVASIPLSLINIFNIVRNAQNKIMSVIKMNFIVAMLTIVLSMELTKFNIEGIAISYLIANIIGAMIVINRIENPKEFTLRLLNEVKKDLMYIIKVRS